LVAGGDTASEEGGIIVDEAYLAGLITSHARATRAAASGPASPRSA
jgi:hypothetical protein